jgi:hypothetical protein
MECIILQFFAWNGVLPTFFVISTFAKKLWDPFVKALHTLHAKKFNLLDKIPSIYSYNKLIHIDPITCAKYYDKKNLFSYIIQQRPMSFCTSL